MQVCIRYSSAATLLPLFPAGESLETRLLRCYKASRLQSLENSAHKLHHWNIVITSRFTIASYPGHVFGGKSGLVSTVCACANDSRNFPRTSPNMDKLHMVVMRRKNQTRYTVCSVVAVFTRRSLFIICRLSY